MKIGRSINLTISIRAASSMCACPSSDPSLFLACDARARVRPPPGSRPAGRWQNGVRARPGRRRADRGSLRRRAPGSGAGLRADAASGRKPVEYSYVYGRAREAGWPSFRRRSGGLSLLSALTLFGSKLSCQSRTMCPCRSTGRQLLALVRAWRLTACTSIMQRRLLNRISGQ